MAQGDELVSMMTAFSDVNLHEHVLQCLILLGKYIKIVEYSKFKMYTPDWCALILGVQRINREDVKRFAWELVNQKYISVAQVMSVLLRSNSYETRMATEFLFVYVCQDADIMRGFPEPEDFEWEKCKDFQRLCRQE